VGAWERAKNPTKATCGAFGAWWDGAWVMADSSVLSSLC
jgi:hypothetical protein